MHYLYNGIMVNNNNKIYLALQLFPPSLRLLLVAGDGLELVGHVGEVGLKLTLGLLGGRLRLLQLVDVVVELGQLVAVFVSHVRDHLKKKVENDAWGHRKKGFSLLGYPKRSSQDSTFSTF